MKRLIAALAVAVALGAPAAAGAFANGQAQPQDLTPIYNPQGAPRQVLAADGAAPAWNTLNLGLWQAHKPMLWSAGDGAAYRPLSGSGFTQNYAWYLYQHGGNLAAYPGTSNHGRAAAIDLYAPSWMRPLLDRYGGAYGWRWGEVPSENWHVTYYGGFGRPNPGVSPAHPYLRLGSGGLAQNVPVAIVQRRLQKLHFFPHHVGGSYNQATRLGVYTYQVARSFKHPNGTVTRDTWIALRQPQAGKPNAANTNNAVGRLSGLKHGDRGPAVALLSRNLAYVRYHARPGEHFYHGPVVSFFTNGLGGALRAWQSDNRTPATGVYDTVSSKLMGTSVRYWHRRFPNAAVPTGPVAADHPAASAPPKPAYSGSNLFADISGNNSSVDLRSYVATKHQIIAIKLTEGDGFRSDSAAARWRLAAQLHMTRLAYDFARPSQNSAAAEAANFAAYAKSLGWHSGDVAVLDWEDPGASGRSLTSWVRTYSSELAKRGIRLGLIYSYGDYIAHTLSAPAFYAPRGPVGYWHAQYSGSVSHSTAPSWAWSRGVAIQFTDGEYGASPHSLPGVGTGDVNRLMVPYSTLIGFGQ